MSGRTAIESATCPNCGSPIQFAVGMDSAICPFCKTQLRIKRGESGFPIATMDGIKADTGLLAREVAIKRLKARYVETSDRRAARESQWERAKALPASSLKSAQSWLSAWFLIGIVGIVGNAVPVMAAGAVLLVLGLLTCARSQKQLNALEYLYLRDNAQIVAELDQLDAQIWKVESEMDRLTEAL